MRDIKISGKFKQYFNKDNRAETILKGITVVACTLSLILVLFMLFSGHSSGYNDLSNELNIVNDGGSGRLKDGQSGDRDSDISRDSNNDESAEQHESSPSPMSDENKTVTLSLTDDEASDLVSLSFSERLPITDVDVSFFAPDTIEVSGIMGKDDLGELFSEQDLPLLRAAMILAPEKLEGELVFNVALDNDGTLVAALDRVLVNGINLTRFIPPSSVESANEALGSLIPEGASLRQITIEDGSITFTLQV